MALSESAVSELLDAFRAGDGVDLIRNAVTMVLQELIEVEATETLGAGRYERTDTRVTDRNGSRPRLLATQAGDIELRIPKLRKGSFFPSILEPRRRIDQALYAVVMEAYVNGVSTRAVDDLVDALGATPGSRSPRCHGSAPGLTTSSVRSAPAASTTSSSPTPISTRRTPACHSSWTSARMAPTSRMTEASLGKIPTTRARRLTSLLSRSSGLVDQTFVQWARGKAAKARTSIRAHTRRLTPRITRKSTTRRDAAWLERDGVAPLPGRTSIERCLVRHGLVTPQARQRKRQRLQALGTVPGDGAVADGRRRRRASRRWVRGEDRVGDR